VVKSVTRLQAWAGEADCRSCALRGSVLFAGLQEADFRGIHQPIDQYLLPAGAVLYRAGDRAERLYTIRSGLLKLVQYLADGSQRIVRLLRTTDIVGLEALLGEPYQHDAVALQPCELCRLPASLVQHLSEQNPAIHQELLQRWQRALTEADAWITLLSTGSARQRMARLLLRLLCDAASTTCELFGREDLGAVLGITTETASRVIAELKREGVLVEIDSNRFHADLHSLRQIAGD